MIELKMPTNFFWMFSSDKYCASPIKIQQMLNKQVF